MKAETKETVTKETIYICDVCGKRSTSMERIVWCEEKHKFLQTTPPPFAEGDVVQDTGVGRHYYIIEDMLAVYDYTPQWECRCFNGDSSGCRIRADRLVKIMSGDELHEQLVSLMQRLVAAGFAVIDVEPDYKKGVLVARFAENIGGVE